MNKQIWLVTGISSGIGKAIAESAISKGYFVIGTFRNNKQVDAFNNTHEGKGFAYQMDLNEPESLESMTEHLTTRFGTVDVLINNAGVGFAGAVEEASMDEIRSVMEVNFFGSLYLTQLILPGMRENRSGQIVQISSHAGIKAFAGFGIYSASKFALEGFSEALAQEVNDLDIKVSIVEPGPFRTEFAGSGLMKANLQIDDYRETAGVFREKLSGIHGSQEGDPLKAAEAIISHIENGAPTLRLPLGAVPLKTIQMKIDSVQHDLNENKGVSEKAVY